MRILVTGFEPFGGEAVNPSELLLKELPDEINHVEIQKLLIPVERKRAREQLEEALRNEKPQAVLSIGQAGGRARVTVERIGINMDDFGIPDNAGEQPRNEAIEPEGPAAYFATLPIHEMVEAMRKQNVPAAISNSAGTYVCNHVMYSALHFAETEAPGMLAGFVHIPFIPSQCLERNAASLSLEDSVRGVTAALELIAETLQA